MSFRWPLNNVKITNGFGTPGPYAQYGPHNGIDLAAPLGTPVYAADDGTVAFEGWGQNHTWMLAPAGICVLINHGGSYAGYAHLKDTVVNKGQAVKKGQLIGHVGATGAATGPHLHFEMLPLSPNFRNGYAGRINPMPYIQTTTNATDAEIRQAYLDVLERPADDAGLAHYRNYPIAFVRQDLAGSQEKRDLDARKAIAAAEAARLAEEAAKTKDAAAKAEADAKAAAEEQLRIAAEEAAAKELAAKKAQQYEDLIKWNSSLLQQLIDLLKKIFNV